MKIQQLYTDVTNRIIADLEAGVPPWVKPWKTNTNGGIMPVNAATKRPYSGINVLILWDSQARNGYPASEWLTFKQAETQGAQVRKGERGSVIVFTEPLLVPTPRNRAPETQGHSETPAHRPSAAGAPEILVFTIVQIGRRPESTGRAITKPLTARARLLSLRYMMRPTATSSRPGADGFIAQIGHRGPRR